MVARPAVSSIQILTVVMAVGLLSACGSGGGASPPSTSPTTSAGQSTAVTSTAASSAPIVEQTVSAYEPGPITFDRAGRLFTSDCFAGYVLRLQPHAPPVIYAGTGVSSEAGSTPTQNAPRTSVQLDCPAGLAVDDAGRLLVAAHADNLVMAIGSDGRMVTVVGMGPPGTLTDDGALVGDGGPATGAQLQEPTQLAFDGQGNLYIADRDNHAVRRVDTQGVITTVAGTGDPGFGGDHGPATDAKLFRPQGVAVTPDGSLYISDGDNARLRKVDRHGVITTIAGKGTKLPIDPEQLLVDSEGLLIVADTSSVRRLSPAGVLTTIAGRPNADATGAEPCSGIGGPATKAVITPVGLAIGPGGELFMSTQTCGVLRLASDGTLRQYVAAPA